MDIGNKLTTSALIPILSNLVLLDWRDFVALLVTKKILLFWSLRYWRVSLELPMISSPSQITPSQLCWGKREVDNDDILKDQFSMGEREQGRERGRTRRESCHIYLWGIYSLKEKRAFERMTLLGDKESERELWILSLSHESQNSLIHSLLSARNGMEEECESTRQQC